MALDTGKLLAALAGISEGAVSVPPPPTSLPSAPPPPIVKGLWYQNKTIKLDGWTFESCRFDSCVLVVNSPYFTIKNCFIDKSSVIQYGELIIKVVQLFNHHASANVTPDFTAIKNPDGTVSIGL
ncbi:hypothetical protein QN375_06045 [Pseudomonas sp. MH9.2]|uniref:hypothetical protein n=1 Tax=unclassified Pseudomonas TaxID=196821 RepID=UPI002AC9C2BA|nr:MULTISPECIES: hypothetical protein [unclassified Pseudomonas]MEB0009328.1 hypothetical protein [Pseudomonas sp. RTB2]MEB0018302.1 hypothetical protein [Pseudomonas sp. RTB3]MEB0025333.1 hypothetical protein [Pseudomonas sp. MH9.2]MEB0147181.1 hypothetical protein [Pseudomonas sp. CCC2.2]MEB0268523.1 hypothetical protein [Pseudomonas sp. 5B4]